MASEAQLQSTLAELFTRLEATENAINTIESLPTKDRLSAQNQAGLRALNQQKADLLQSIDQIQQELERLNEILVSDADAPAISPNRTAFGAGGLRGTNLRVQENAQRAELEAAEEDLAQAILDGKTGRAITNRERNVAALRNELEQTQQALKDLEVPTRSVPLTANQRLQNQVNTSVAENVNPQQDPQTPQEVETTEEQFAEAERLAAEREQAALDAQAQALLAQARNQASLSEQRNANPADWRVRLRLAPSATYLYKAPEPGILAPLLETDGVIFPYTPRIDVAYRSDYQTYQPTHSNYKHYFYKGSSVEFVTMTVDFTAQDTQEAEYMLAVIHFLRSANKMFYGQDEERGSPPPLVYLSGLGEYQFNEHPCVIQEFNYNLPEDVDYIRARSKQISSNDTLQFRRPLSTGASPSYSLSSIRDRLRGAGLPQGATFNRPAAPALGTENPTYVPTKITMTLTLLPVQSRQQVSQQFSLKEYANGNLLKRGMW